MRIESPSPHLSLSFLSHNMKKHTAFTLIELLVVISIIGILVAMLIPVLGKSKSLAARLQCASVMRQGGMCWNIYQLDFKDTLPLFYWGYTAYSFRLLNGGSDPTQTYFRDVFHEKVRQCPTYNSRSLGADTGFDWGFALPFQSNYYAAAGFMDDRADDATNPRFVKIRPGKSQELTAGWVTYNYDPTNDIFPILTDYLQDSNNSYTISPHSSRARQGYVDPGNRIGSEGANSVWKDNHVEWHDWPYPERAIDGGPDIYLNYPHFLAMGVATLGNGKRTGWTSPGNYFFRPYFWIKGDNGGP